MSEERNRLIDQLRLERESFERTISPLSPTQMAQLEIVDRWTVKDIMAHITAWEVELLRWLDSASHGYSPDIPGPAEWTPFIEQFNSQAHMENRSRTLDDVLDSFKRVYSRVLDELQALPKDSSDPYWSVWRDGRPPWDLFGTYYEHYREHRKQIKHQLEVMEM
jgi:hypothetical protein